jgi:gliding motility-associated-like protein
VDNLATATGTPPSGPPVTGTSTDPTPCATCTTSPSCTTCTITPLINAREDNYTNIACDITAVTGNILANDTIGNTPVNSTAETQVSLTILSGSYPNISIDANGAINLSSGIAAGSYTFTYKICSVAIPNLCDQATVTINVTDTTNPIWTSALPGDTIASCDNIPAMPTLTGSDSCGNVTVTPNQQIIAGTCPNSYTIIRTWTLTDASGNQVTHTQTITVQDTTAPTFVESLPANVTVECDAIPTAEILTATDNCGTAAVTYNEVRTDGSCSGTYALTRTWTATDLCGLTTVHTQTVNVEDTTAPILATPYTAVLAASCDAIPVIPALTFTDDCSSTPITTSFNETATPVASNGTYTITRTWDVSDACSNSRQYTQTINVTISNYFQTFTTDTECTVDIDLEVDVMSIINLQFGNQPTNGTWTDVSSSGALDYTNGVFTPLNLANGSYIVRYETNDADCPRVFEVTIPVDKNVCTVENCVTLNIYNAVTPNGDGMNENFVIENITNLDCYPENSVEIYNRWGVKVFDTTNYDNNTRVFNGTSEGRDTVKQSAELPTGTYFYILKYKTIEGNYVTKNGYLYLTR